MRTCHTPSLTLLVLISLWCMIIPNTSAQDATSTPMKLSSSPNPAFRADKFDYTNSFRQNVCSLQKAIDNNTVELQYALRGLDLRTVALPDEYFLFDFTNNTLDENYAGVIPEIMDEIADRAGFRWRDSFAVTDFDVGNNTWTDVLKWSTTTYDMSLSWWHFTIPRVKLGVTFPEGWYDASIIMVGKESSEPHFEAWTWAEPFSPEVWLLIIANIIFSGFMYWFLELIDKHSDAKDLEESLIHNIFLSGVNFTTHFFFEPRTNASRLFTLSLSFWAMLMGAAYTANLASFLVIDNSSTGVDVRTLNEAVKSNLKFCVLRGAAVNDTIYRNFGDNNLDVVGFPNTETQLQGLVADECHLAVVELNAFEYWERQISVNENCNLKWVGKPYKFSPSGFATISDSGSKCTSLIKDVIDTWMLILKEEGFIERAWQTHLDRLATQKTCSVEENADISDNPDQLTMKNMGGIFIMHAIASVLSIIIAIVYKCAGWDKIPRFAKTGPGGRKNVREMLEERAKAGETLTIQEQRLLHQARRMSLPEQIRNIKHLKRASFARNRDPEPTSPLPEIADDALPERKSGSIVSSSPEDNNDAESFDAPSPDIHDEVDLYKYLDPSFRSIGLSQSQQYRSGSTVDMAGEIARLSNFQQEQIEAMKEVREQMNFMIDIIKDKVA